MKPVANNAQKAIDIPTPPAKQAPPTTRTTKSGRTARAVKNTQEVFTHNNNVKFPPKTLAQFTPTTNQTTSKAPKPSLISNQSNTIKENDSSANSAPS